MHVRRILTWPELAAIETEWNALAGEAPFRSWDWLATWWKHYGNCSDDRGHGAASNRQLHVLAVYDTRAENSGDTEQLIGIAPWYIESSAIKGNVIRWLGDGEVCTDHVSLICQPKHIDDVVSAIADALTEQFHDWDSLELNNVDADDALAGLLVEKLEERNNTISSEDEGECWVLDLPASWDEYLADISKSHRKQLRQLERRVIESGRVVYHRVEQRADLDTAWNVLVDLHQRRRQSLGEPGCFASRAFHDFHREVAERMFNRGQLRMSWLELDGTPAAAEYHFAGSTATYAYQGGVDPERLEDEPGRISTILFLQQAIAEQHRKLDFLRGDEPYKAHWRATPRMTKTFRIVPNRRLARLRGQASGVATVLGEWARQGAQILYATVGN